MGGNVKNVVGQLRLINYCVRFGDVAAATPPNQPYQCILTDYFKNFNFSKLK
jgi:hypothetical protein